MVDVFYLDVKSDCLQLLDGRSSPQRVPYPAHYSRLNLGCFPPRVMLRHPASPLPTVRGLSSAAGDPALQMLKDSPPAKVTQIERLMAASFRDGGTSCSVIEPVTTECIPPAEGDVSGPFVPVTACPVQEVFNLLH
ncbi:unnamed protein product [Pleuronectes platessa]|uniref:Uncharacterized protein n=1 Tax=Pleuronectes platessa TaxID=8262 RepID=A0A9N7TW22_PLEPL|nr:unnamed protein product [Pleuronectes platessa]